MSGSLSKITKLQIDFLENAVFSELLKNFKQNDHLKMFNEKMRASKFILSSDHSKKMLRFITLNYQILFINCLSVLYH